MKRFSRRTLLLFTFTALVLPSTSAFADDTAIDLRRKRIAVAVSTSKSFDEFVKNSLKIISQQPGTSESPAGSEPASGNKLVSAETRFEDVIKIFCEKAQDYVMDEMSNAGFGVIDREVTQSGNTINFEELKADMVLGFKLDFSNPRRSPLDLPEITGILGTKIGKYFQKGSKIFVKWSVIGSNGINIIRESSQNDDALSIKSLFSGNSLPFQRTLLTSLKAGRPIAPEDLADSASMLAIEQNLAQILKRIGGESDTLFVAAILPDKTVLVERIGKTDFVKGDTVYLYQREQRFNDLGKLLYNQNTLIGEAMVVRVKSESYILKITRLEPGAKSPAKDDIVCKRLLETD